MIVGILVFGLAQLEYFVVAALGGGRARSCSVSG